VVLYCFWAQALVCDEYFVPTIEVISDKLKIPDDIAGATIMALGCNGPELFINSMSMFKKSDLGVGAVIGGEVFNILVLIGCALLATPMMYMPLRISKFSFSRDVFFYALSIGLIYFVLKDNRVTLFDSILLLSGGVAYSTFVALSSKIRGKFTRRPAEPSEPNDGSILEASLPNEVPSPSWESPKDPEEGCFLSVRVHMTNRMQDRYRHWDTRFVNMTRDGLVVSTDVRDRYPIKYGRTARGIVFQHDSHGVGQWCHGGLVNAPTFKGEYDHLVSNHKNTGSAVEVAADGTVERAASALGSSMGTSNIAVPRASSDPQANVDDLKAELISFRDVVKCTLPLDPTVAHFELQVLQRDSTFGKVIILEFDAKSIETRDRFVIAIRMGINAIVNNAVRQTQDGLSQMSITTMHEACTSNPIVPKQRNPAKAALLEWADWVRFPVRFLLRVTIPSMKDERMQRYVHFSFVISMMWLALFSFMVVEVCNVISYEFNISVTILGFTVAAIGTSFPNVISCIAVSQQGKTAMAIANALGANIQNVFIALALPWFVKTSIVGSFVVTTSDLDASVVAMLVTLVLLVVTVCIACCTMPKWSGVVFLVTYAIYLVLSFGEEFGCGTRWPFC
jgi:K+-dependent Na+/Ca+ exchanger-like protein